jgi:glycosyltransferase involved in cell wall biosynthesis
MSNFIINGRFLGKQPTGVDRFAYEVLRALDTMIANDAPEIVGLSFRLAVPKSIKCASPFAKIPLVSVGSRSGHAWEQVDLPLFASGQVLLNLCNTGPIWYKRQLVVIHDAATFKAPSSYSSAFRLWYSLMIPSLYRWAVSVCTVSEFSKNDLAVLLGARAGVVVLPEGTDHMDRTVPNVNVLTRVGLNSRSYMLAVSSLAPHKNFETVVRAVEEMGDVGFDIAIAGGQNPTVFASSGKQLSSSVKYAGYVTDAELKALYENASCFIFPSIYEGYGLPPTEAMACGCPVIASNAAAIPETCGDAALYFDPHDASDLVRVLRKFMSQPQLQDTMRSLGQARAKTMRWRNTAIALINEIRRVA